MSGQNTTEAWRKHLMTKKVRIKAWQEKGDSAINMAECRIKAWQEKGDSAINMAECLGYQGRLGHQKLTKE
jgi:hypothetical protein